MRLRTGGDRRAAATTSGTGSASRKGRRRPRTPARGRIPPSPHPANGGVPDARPRIGGRGAAGAGAGRPPFAHDARFPSRARRAHRRRPGPRGRDRRRWDRRARGGGLPGTARRPRHRCGARRGAEGCGRRGPDQPQRRARPARHGPRPRAGGRGRPGRGRRASHRRGRLAGRAAAPAEGRPRAVAAPPSRGPAGSARRGRRRRGRGAASGRDGHLRPADGGAPHRDAGGRHASGAGPPDRRRRDSLDRAAPAERPPGAAIRRAGGLAGADPRRGARAAGVHRAPVPRAPSGDLPAARRRLDQPRRRGRAPGLGGGGLAPPRRPRPPARGFRRRPPRSAAAPGAGRGDASVGPVPPSGGGGLGLLGDRAPRRRGAPDAAVPGTGGEPGVGGRLGARRGDRRAGLARPRAAQLQGASPGSRRARRRRGGGQRARLSPRGLAAERGPCGASAGLGAGPGAGLGPLRLAARPRRDGGASRCPLRRRARSRAGCDRRGAAGRAGRARSRRPSAGRRSAG